MGTNLGVFRIGTVCHSLAEAIHDVCGEATEILRKDPVTGGDINRAYILSISDGHKLFLKENRAGKIDFYAGYYTEIEKVPGYEDRRDLYNLYHLLNHLNLFGDSYLGDVMNIVQRYS